MILSNLQQRLGAAVTRIVRDRRRLTSPSMSPAALEAALASLLEPSRTVFLLHARDQLPLGEVAPRLDLSVPDVEQHLAAALVDLDRQIGTISPQGMVAPGPADR